MSTTTTPTTTPTREPEQRAAAEFVDLVCDDVELLRAEFDDLIAASWDDPPSPRPPSPPRRPAWWPTPRVRPGPAGIATEDTVVSPPTAAARQRGPPRGRG